MPSQSGVSTQPEYVFPWYGVVDSSFHSFGLYNQDSRHLQPASVGEEPNASSPTISLKSVGEEATFPLTVALNGVDGSPTIA